MEGGGGITNRPVEVHLPCPPLHEWLPILLADKRVGAWSNKRTPRALRSQLAKWPVLEIADEGGSEGGEPRPRAEELAALEVLIFAVRLERPEPPEACLALLRPGTLIVELALPRARIIRRLLGLERPPAKQATLSQARVLQWLARGYHQLEQWETVDPHGVLVTLARSR